MTPFRPGAVSSVVTAANSSFTSMSASTFSSGLTAAGEVERTTWGLRGAAKKLPEESRSLYEDCGMVDGEQFGVPANLNRLSVGRYVNHPPTPNLGAGGDRCSAHCAASRQA